MQCDVKNVADSLKLPDKQCPQELWEFPNNYGLHCLFSSSARPCVISIPCCFTVTCLYTRSLVSSLEENKVIRGKRRQGRRRRVHKEDLLLLDNLIQTFSFCAGSILHLLSPFCEHMRSARDPYSRVVFFPTCTPVPNMYPAPVTTSAPPDMRDAVNWLLKVNFPELAPLWWPRRSSSTRLG